MWASRTASFRHVLLLFVGSVGGKERLQGKRGKVTVGERVADTVAIFLQRVIQCCKPNSPLVRNARPVLCKELFIGCGLRVNVEG